MLQNKKIIFTLSLIFALCVGTYAGSYAVENKTAAKTQKAPCKTEKTVQPAKNIRATYAKPLQLVQNPQKFLGQYIKMNATFDKFSTLGLDYPKALRPSTNYIGFLIQRDDVVDHNIPLSEMKLFLKREYAEKFIDLNTGDRIEIQGKMFSDALDDVWIDVEKLTVLKKAKADTDKKEEDKK